MGLLFWLDNRTTRFAESVESEGVLHREAGRGSVTYRRYRGPRGYAYWERVGARWLLVATRYRLLVASGKGPMINVPWSDPRFDALVFSVDRNRLLIRFDAAAFRADSRGTIEVRMRCAEVEPVLRVVERQRARYRPDSDREPNDGDSVRD